MQQGTKSPGRRLTARLLVGPMVVLGLLALWTLWPVSSADPNGLGYRSHCPFAPTSTLILSVGAAAVWQLRRYLLE